MKYLLALTLSCTALAQNAAPSAQETLKAATIPAGTTLTLFAAEPEIVNPIAFCIDARGRLWVVEGRTYPKRAKDGEGQDRVLVFTDKDGDGKADKREVFIEGLNLVSGIEVGHDGVWIGAAPNLLFIPVRDWEKPTPAGEPRVVLDGWGFQDTHETLNTFKWGPDGWLYGCHGVFTHSKVGKPGTPDAERVKINAGVWRYHPTREVFEVFAHGTSNPWGLDWDARGQMFVEACVIPHLFHIVPGGRYQRQAGQHFDKHTYDDIKTIADHRHYLGANPHGGNGKSDSAGGGHAHAGLAILKDEKWGALRGGVLMGNIHGQRINMDILEPAGSGFIGKHGADLIAFNDPASQVVDIREGPDGALFMIDWYDLNQCHRTQREAHDYEKGRIYRLTPPGKQNAAPTKTALHQLWKAYADGTSSDPEKLRAEFSNADADVRAWAVRLAVDFGKDTAALDADFLRLAQKDPSPVVRLALAYAAQKLPLERSKPIVLALAAHAEDASDHNLPLMIWYAAAPLAADPATAAELLGAARIPKLQELIARRMAEK